MSFEKCSRCEENWQPVDHETLVREVPNKDIDMMIWHKATVRVGLYKYRRVIPEEIIDWAKAE